jgi:nitrogen fixation protein FixH
MTRRFTGWHMLATLVAFFGVVIAVNMTMATLATRTFGGVVVKNSYVANQHFNAWLAEARAQDRLGWALDADIVDRRVLVTAGANGAALGGADVTAVAAHPLGSVPDIALRFLETAPGHYVAQARLPAGRWRVRFHVARDGRQGDFVQDLAE